MGEIKRNRPPKWINRILDWYCHEKYANEIRGDLMELYDRWLEKGKFIANIKYVLNAILFMRVYNSKINPGQDKTHLIMIKSNLKIGYRNILKNKLHAGINIGGLCVGFASCFVIFHFLSHELSYDRFHSNKENIYRININMPDGTGEYTPMINTQPALAEDIKTSFPQISNITRMRYVNRIVLSRGDIQFYETSGYYADSSFLEIFDFPLVNGDQSAVLSEPSSITISKQLAQKYFGDDNPLGQLLNLNGNKTLTVTGVFEPIPSNSHLQFDFLISFSTYEVPRGVLADLSSWGWLGFLTYVKLEDGSDVNQFQSDLDRILEQKTNFSGQPYTSEVQPLNDIYLKSDHLSEDPVSGLKSGSTFSIYSVGVAAILILMVAAFNFMNLAFALYMKRVKEVGLRKVLGVGKFKLIEQLLTESTMISLIGVVIGYTIYRTCFPYISSILGWGFGINSVHYGTMILLVICLALLIGIVSVIYPAAILTGIKPIAILRKSSGPGIIRGKTLRNALMTLQFGISICLIIGTMVITQQIKYINEKSLGFDKESVVVIKLLPEDMARYFDTYKNQIIQHSHVVGVTRSGRPLGNPWPVNSLSAQVNGQLISHSVQANWTDVDYFKTLGIPIKEGRSFSRDFASDGRQAIVLNEQAVKEFGLENPIGTSVSFWGDRKIIGVVEDFNFSSLHDHIAPAVVVPMFLDVEFMYVRVSQGNLYEKVAFLEQQWTGLGNDIPLNVTFLDDEINTLYHQEKRLSNVIQTFSGLAIILACLGMFALVATLVTNKLKEVSIRKVLGASAKNIVALLSKDFVRLVLIANFVAWPIAWFIMNSWLENFAYRTDFGISIFLLTGLISFTIALLTVGWQTVRVAIANPVNSLKDE